MSKSIKVSDGVWKVLINIKIRDNKKSMEDVITDLLKKAEEDDQ